jgi:hypothetical protein
MCEEEYMDEDPWKRLDQKRTFLKKKLRVTSTLLLDSLFEQELITEDERDEIVKKHRTDKDKFNYLIQALKRNSKDRFPDFLKCLRFSEQGHVADDLEKEAATEIERADEFQGSSHIDYDSIKALGQNLISVLKKLLEYIAVFFIIQVLLWYFFNLHIYVGPYKRN